MHLHYSLAYYVVFCDISLCFKLYMSLLRVNFDIMGLCFMFWNSFTSNLCKGVVADRYKTIT